MKQIYFILFFVLINFISFSQTNIDVSSAITINSFPHTESNLDSSAGGSSAGTNGGCAPICCNSLYYRIEIPSNGDLTVVNDNFVGLAGSILAYTSDIPNPTSNSDLTYLNVTGNFCGFRDTLTLTNLVAGSVYYLLIFNENQETSQGQVSNFNFSFTPDVLLGVEEYEINKVFIIPNPSSDFIKINGFSTIENYRIYNTLGKEVKKGIVLENEKIDIQNLTNGLYFLKFENGSTIKFIKE